MPSLLMSGDFVEDGFFCIMGLFESVMGPFFVNLRRTVEGREGQEGPVRKQDKGDMRWAGWGSTAFIFFFSFFPFFFERIFHGFYSKGMILNIVLCFIIHFGCSISENYFI